MGTEVRSGRTGIVRSVDYDGTAEILFTDIPGEAPATIVHVNPGQRQQVQVQVATHEVLLLNNRGRPTGNVLLATLIRDHGDDFFDIFCLDGREGCHVHSSFLRQLPENEYTDLCYEAGATPTKSAVPLEVGDQIALRMEELADKEKYGANVCLDKADRLPASGLIKRQPSLFHRVASKGCVPAQEKCVDESDSCSLASQLAAEEDSTSKTVYGSSVCPFMETKAGGLEKMVAACSFTEQDIVFDLGCGTGAVLGAILSAYPCIGVGVELNSALARRAKKNLRQFGSRVSFIVDDVRNVDLSQATA